MTSRGSVRVISECFIKAKRSVVDDESKKEFYLGSFDLVLMSHCYHQMGLLFRKLPLTEDNDNGSIKSEYMERLRESLKTTLGYFYPLTGEFVTVVEQDVQKSFIYVDCNKGPGAKFIHAALYDMSVNDITTPTYVPNIVQLFFDLGQMPRNYDASDAPILVVQVTELIDGIFLGVSVNHCVVDGTTMWHFLSSWSEIFQSNKDTMVISRPPICERWYPEGHGPMLRFSHVQPGELGNLERNETLMEAIFHISSKSIVSLKKKANAECGVVSKISSFQALAAAIWKSIVCARRSPHNEDSICIIAVNARPRMVPPLSQDYIGSFGVASFNSVKVSELVKSSLGKVSLLVHQKVQEVTFDHLRDRFVRWMESPFFAPVGAPSPHSIVISGTSREDMSNIAFGHGKAVMVLSGSDKYDGKVVLHPGKEGTGSVSAQICLSPDAMIALQLDEEFVSLIS